MSTTNDFPKLVAKVFITGEIELLTGLRIGGSESGISIGGVDNVIIRNATDGKPYIPGSSLKGKMRCLLEKVHCPGELKSVGNSKIFTCDSLDTYNDPQKGKIFHVFGITNDDIKKKDKDKKDKEENEEKHNQSYKISSALPTRLIVRDASLTEESAQKLEESLYVDLPYTQVKTEVVIDRITSAANPRQVERVPAGVKFNYAFVLNLYNPPDLEKEWLKYILYTLKEGMDLLEDDYLGGMGSRGYGQIKFATREIKVENLNTEISLEENSTFKDWRKEFESKVSQ